MEETKIVPAEPWLRGTHTEISAVPRAVLHALELAKEDLERWAGHLTDEELRQQPPGIPSVAFHLRHIAGSLDRLLTYAEGGTLCAEQIARLRTEGLSEGTRKDLFDEFSSALELSAMRIRRLAVSDFGAGRNVGSRQLPTTLGGLLVHVADHTQRHVGQAVTTAKIVVASRALE